MSTMFGNAQINQNKVPELNDSEIAVESQVMELSSGELRVTHATAFKKEQSCYVTLRYVIINKRLTAQISRQKLQLQFIKRIQQYYRISANEAAALPEVEPTEQ